MAFIGQFWPLTSLTLDGGTRFDFNVDLMGSSASQRAAWPYMAVSPEESGQVDLSLPAIALGMQKHLLVLDCAPQPFHQDVVVAALLPDQLILIFSACSLAKKSVQVNWQP